jgi:hypothetical protein
MRGGFRIVIGDVKFAGKFGAQRPNDGSVTKSVMAFTSAGQLGLDVGQHLLGAMVGPGQFIYAALDAGGAIFQRCEPRSQGGLGIAGRLSGVAQDQAEFDVVGPIVGR